MKKIRYVITALAMAVSMSGCEKFLDVNPKSEVVDDDMFTSAEGYEDALYGIYGKLSSDSELYGLKLSFVLPEIMSHNFFKNSSGTDPVQYLAAGNWSYIRAHYSSYFGDIWTNAYNAISFCNNIIGHAEKDGNDKYRYSKLYRGEALALRAFIHFDLLRYFAVDYNSDNETRKAKAIPYTTKYNYKVTPYSSVKEVYGYVIADLIEAEKCMEADKLLVPDVRSNVAEGFTSSRIIHINLYAVQALLARVYFYMGDMENAGTYAEKVIESGKFPLMTAADFNNYENGTLSLKETVWGLYSLYGSYSNYCAGALIPNSGAPIEVTKQEIENLYLDYTGPAGETDLRLKWFASISSNNPNVKNNCVKLINKIYMPGTEAAKYSGSSYLGANMIRIAEMYLIAANAYLGRNAHKTSKYMNDLVQSRGLPRFEDRGTGVAITEDVIFNEFRKELYGEGQLWFNMKRLKKNIVTLDGILNGNDDDTYTIPIPVAEDNGRE